MFSSEVKEPIGQKVESMNNNMKSNIFTCICTIVQIELRQLFTPIRANT